MIKQLFTDIASVYDRMNHLLSMGRDCVWRKKAVSCVPHSPIRVLDLACGTGDLMVAIRTRFPQTIITGLDLTPAMLEIARDKMADSSHVTFVEGDACAFPSTFATHSFDLITCGFGFRNFPNRDAALRECARAITDNGYLLVLEFFRPQIFAFGIFTAFWLRLLVFLFVRSRSSAYDYLRHSMAKMITVAEFIDRADDAGFCLVFRRFFFPCCTCLLFKRKM